MTISTYLPDDALDNLIDGLLDLDRFDTLDPRNAVRLALHGADIFPASLRAHVEADERAAINAVRAAVCRPGPSGRLDLDELIAAEAANDSGEKVA